MPLVPRVNICSVCTQAEGNSSFTTAYVSDEAQTRSRHLLPSCPNPGLLALEIGHLPLHSTRWAPAKHEMQRSGELGLPRPLGSQEEEFPFPGIPIICVGRGYTMGTQSAPPTSHEEVSPDQALEQ